MKTTASRFLPLALTAAALLASSSALAGPGSGVTIWRGTNRDTASTDAAHALRPCTDARFVSVAPARWSRGNGRTALLNTPSQKLVCTSCATSAKNHLASDRNAHSPKSNFVAQATHDCSQFGCRGPVAVAP